MTEFLEGSVFWGAAISLLAYETGLIIKKKFKMAVLIRF